MRRTIRVHRQADANVLQVRRGEDVLGTLGAVEAGTDLMSGKFSHRPAWQDSADTFAELAGLIAAGEAAGAARIAELRDRIEAQGIHVHHSQHDMRVDEPRSVVIEKGMARFRPTQAFLSLRTGGH